jgi:hypothetical protein
MTKLAISIFCLTLNFSAIAIFVYMKYLLSLDRGFSTGVGIWLAIALLFLSISTLVFYLTKHGTVIKFIWFTSAFCVLVLLFID